MKFLTIIYAHRNRDLERIKASLTSLKNQKDRNFEVTFIDYGSEEEKVDLLHDLLAKFPFVKFIPLEVSPLLWNKSKALNIGIKRASSPYIFIADVDLIFHPEATGLMGKVAKPTEFNLFTLAYLTDKESKKLAINYEFDKAEVRNYGKVNGMVLASKEAFHAINGFDEFFHFYGAEDEDLYSRFENAGFKRNLNTKFFFYHQWHKTFPASEENVLSKIPRIENIRRINQRHFLVNKDKKIIKPERQFNWGLFIEEKEFTFLEFPTREYCVPNILSYVEHFLNEELPSLNSGEIVKAKFIEDPYFPSLKHKVKKVLGKQTQPYCSLKEVNDMILKKIVYQYRNFIYSYKVAEDFKTLFLTIRL